MPLRLCPLSLPLDFNAHWIIHQELTLTRNSGTIDLYFPSSSFMDSDNGFISLAFPVTWKSLSESNGRAEWEMVVPRMVRPVRLTPLPTPFATPSPSVNKLEPPVSRLKKAVTRWLA